MPVKTPSKQPIARRAPQQQRARQTQLLIFEAAIRVLDKEGLSGFNTNRIAEVAGYSVGTLYQYFRDKHALLEALARHEQERVLGEIQRLLQRQRLASEPPGTRIRALLTIVRKVFGGRMRARRSVFEWALRQRRTGDVRRPVLEIAEHLVAAIPLADGSTPMTPAEAFVITRAVAGAIRSALMRNERLLGDPEFEAALVDLVLGFMHQREHTAGARRRDAKL